MGGRGEGFPYGVAGVGEGGVGEPAEVLQAVVAGQAQARDEEGLAGDVSAGVLPLLSEGGESAFGGPVPVGGCPAVLGVVVGSAQCGADGAMQVVGPDRVGVFGDHGPFDEPAGRRLVGEACGVGGQVQVEGIEQAGAAQDVPLVGGEVGEGAGDEGGEGVVEVGRGGGSPGSGRRPGRGGAAGRVSAG